MSEFFVDTSALAKRYIPEVGTSWVTKWIEPQANNIIVVSSITSVEMVSVLMRREREGSVSATDRTRLQNDFLFHVQKQYVVVAVSKEVLVEARRLLVSYPLRALDALQLASILYIKQSTDFQPTFISADTRLLDAAAAEGFTTDNPNKHP